MIFFVKEECNLITIMWRCSTQLKPHLSLSVCLVGKTFCIKKFTLYLSTGLGEYNFLLRLCRSQGWGQISLLLLLASGLRKTFAFDYRGLGNLLCLSPTTYWAVIYSKYEEHVKIFPESDLARSFSSYLLGLIIVIIFFSNSTI